MKKKILTLLIVGGLLLGTSGVGMAYANNESNLCQDQVNQTQKENIVKRQNENESNTGRQNKSDDVQQYGRNGILEYSKFSGMTEEEIIAYMNNNECSLTELATKKGNLEGFMETLQEEK